MGRHRQACSPSDNLLGFDKYPSNVINRAPGTAKISGVKSMLKTTHRLTQGNALLSTQCSLGCQLSYYLANNLEALQGVCYFPQPPFSLSRSSIGSYTGSPFYAIQKKEEH